MMSPEERVFYRLLDFYESRPPVYIHSGHPPSGKAYVGPLLRFPKHDASGKVTRDRYHLDYLIQIGPILILQELKGTASESSEDIEKLRSFMRSYELPLLKQLMGRRVQDVNVLNELLYVVPSLGYEIDNAVLPKDFIGFRAWDGGVEVKIGSKVDASVAVIIRNCLG